MMETARDLNMETDEMQLVVSALRGVGKRIVEVAQTHKPLFAGELFLTGKEVCERLYISPAPCRTTETGRLYPTRSLQGRYSTRLRTWKGCWRRITILSPFEFSIIIRLKIPINKYCQYRILPIPLYPKLN